MSEIAILLRNVSKSFRRYAHLVDWLNEILLPGKSRADEFWALQDTNLKVAKGQTLGFFGRNGSSKSTLLQIFVGTLTPTTGEVKVNGQIAAFADIGDFIDQPFNTYSRYKF